MIVLNQYFINFEKTSNNLRKWKPRSLRIRNSEKWKRREREMKSNFNTKVFISLRGSLSPKFLIPSLLLMPLRLTSAEYCLLPRLYTVVGSKLHPFCVWNPFQVISTGLRDFILQIICQKKVKIKYHLSMTCIATEFHIIVANLNENNHNICWYIKYKFNYLRSTFQKLLLKKLINLNNHNQTLCMKHMLWS